MTRKLAFFSSTNVVAIFLAVTTLGLQGVIAYRTLWRKAPPRSQAEVVRTVPVDTVVDITELPVRGNTDARVVLLEFGDYECPFCAEYSRDIRPRIDEKYVKSGKLRYGFVHTPLPMHSNARAFAAASICAGHQARFWDMHERLFEEQPRRKEFQVTMASELGLRANEFSACVDNTKATNSVIERDLALGKRLGITSTPTFALGTVDSAGRLSIRELISGAQPFETFEQELQKLM